MLGLTSAIFLYASSRLLMCRCVSRNGWLSSTGDWCEYLSRSADRLAVIVLPVSEVFRRNAVMGIGPMGPRRGVTNHEEALVIKIRRMWLLVAGQALQACDLRTFLCGLSRSSYSLAVQVW